MRKEEVVTIDKNKVYSSYYARACKIFPNSRLVAISIGIPDNFKGEICRELNPHSQLLWDYKNGKCTWEEYVERYKEGTLSRLNPHEIYQKLKGKVILCYCGKQMNCHRHIVMEWLRENLGEETVGYEI